MTFSFDGRLIRSVRSGSCAAVNGYEMFRMGDGAGQSQGFEAWGYSERLLALLGRYAHGRQSRCQILRVHLDSDDRQVLSRGPTKLHA